MIINKNASEPMWFRGVLYLNVLFATNSSIDFSVTLPCEKRGFTLFTKGFYHFHDIEIMIAGFFIALQLADTAYN